MKGSIMKGFAKGLISAIIGTIGMIVSYVGMILALTASEAAEGLPIDVNGQSYVLSGEELTTFLNSMQASITVCSIISLVFSVVALIFGILAIVTFVKEKKANRRKPIPALITGIEGVVTSVCSLLFIVLSVALINLLLI